MLAVRTRKPAGYDDVPTLPLYRSAPALDVRLEEFELFAIDRLRVLKGISDGLSRGKKHEEMEKLMNDLWKTNMRHPQASEDINKDIISHFVLRLVYCRTEELRKWFLSMETALFRHRFRNERPEAQRSLMAEFGLAYKKVDISELESVMDKLNQVARSTSQSLPTGGFPCCHTHLRSHLSKALMLTNRNWTSTIVEQEKNRLTPIVETLSTSYLGPDYSQAVHYLVLSWSITHGSQFV